MQIIISIGIKSKKTQHCFLMYYFLLIKLYLKCIEKEMSIKQFNMWKIHNDYGIIFSKTIKNYVLTIIHLMWKLFQKKFSRFHKISNQCIKFFSACLRFFRESKFVKIILCLSHLNNYHKAEANPPKLNGNNEKLESATFLL